MHDYLINNGMLKNFLIMNDRYSMMNSIEVRSPFLDYRLNKYKNLNIKYKFNKKFNNIYDKFIIRELIPSIIPDDVKWRKSKSSFSSNYSVNFQKQFFNEMIQEIKNSNFLNSFIDVKLLIKNIDENNEEIKNVGNFLENLYSIAVLDKRYNLKLK